MFEQCKRSTFACSGVITCTACLHVVHIYTIAI